MKIIHTADIHLSKDHPERMEALEKIVDLCEEVDADLLLIAGDLFDRNTGPDDFETEIRPLFSDNSFQTLVIPGNHDESAFREESYFGSDIQQLTAKPFESKDFEGLKVTGVPFTDEGFSELVEPLSEERDEEKINLLMIHCTLSGVTGGFGEESEYLPVRPEQIVATGYDYVFSGHIHSSATRKDIGGSVFTYPGSPVSISSSETGKRKVWVFDSEDGSLETRDIESFHYIKKRIELVPEETGKIDETVENLKERELDDASVLIELGGFTDRKIEGITEDLKERVAELEPLELSIDSRGLESMETVVKSDIYREFKQKMDKRELEKPREVEKKFLRALSMYERD